MPTTSQGIYYPDAATNAAPLHTVLATMASSINAILGGDVQIHKVANTTQRAAAYATHGASAANPLFVWRTDAPNGRELEYTKNGSTWYYVKTSEDTMTSMVQRGTASAPSGGIAPHAAGSGITVTFPVAFPGPPTVVVGLARATGYFLGGRESGISATGFTLTPSNLGASTTPAGQNTQYSWIAVY